MKQIMNCVFIPHEKIEETLATPPSQGKKNLEPLKTFSSLHNIPINIVEDVNVENGTAEVHMHEADLWQCLEGEVAFIHGGTMMEPRFKKNKDETENRNEIRAEKISGGTVTVLKQGDWLWIPAGQPHQHSCKGTARLLIIKIPKTG